MKFFIFLVSFILFGCSEKENSSDTKNLVSKNPLFGYWKNTGGGTDEDGPFDPGPVYLHFSKKRLTIFLDCKADVKAKGSVKVSYDKNLFKSLEGRRINNPKDDQCEMNIRAMTHRYVFKGKGLRFNYSGSYTLWKRVKNFPK